VRGGASAPASGGQEHVGRILRLTGRAGAARARRLAERLEARGRRCFVLDAAALARLNADLAPGAPERERRRAEVAAMMAAAGIVVLMPD
jgi:adenylylsulfate kinase-like enzyme